MPKFQDITGQRFGRLTVLAPRRKTLIYWWCQCDCGRGTIVKNPGKTQSCGCLKSVGVKTHGKTFTPTWWSWSGMINRCNNLKKKNYGGRGITVCDRWLKFENFLIDMGERPVGTTLDRVDNSGNYEPSNCRWATLKQQANNRRPNWIGRRREIDGRFAS